jgi:uncharacterized repeat protein (TIGR01451 family)
MTLLAVSTAAFGAALDKSFSPSIINVGGVTTLTFTVTNPAGAGALSNVGFVDTLPSGLQVANPPAVGGTCSNAAAATIATAGGGTITATNLYVPAGAATCTLTVNVTNAAGQSNQSCTGNPANFTNASGNVSVSNVTNSVQPSCVVVATAVTAAPTAVPTLGELFISIMVSLIALIAALALRSNRNMSA